MKVQFQTRRWHCKLLFTARSWSKDHCIASYLRGFDFCVAFAWVSVSAVFSERRSACGNGSAAVIFNMDGVLLLSYC